MLANQVTAELAGVKAGRIQLCQVAGNTVIPCGNWRPVALRWVPINNDAGDDTSFLWFSTTGNGVIHEMVKCYNFCKDPRRSNV